MENIAVWLIKKESVIVISVVILLVAAVVLLIGWRVLRDCSGYLEQALAEIKENQGKKTFLIAFEKIDHTIQQLSYLSSPWKEFKKTLLLGDASKETAAVSSPFSSGHFLTIDNLLQKHINIQLYHAVPNFLTGGGILGTFMGLAAGVYLAKDGLSDPAKVFTSLQLLLDGASLSFMTSISGLIASIVFTVIFKKILYGVENKRAELVSMIDEQVSFISLEGLVKEQGETTASNGEVIRSIETIAQQDLELSKERTEVLGAFVQEIAFNLTSSLTNALDSSLKEPLLSALTDLRSAINDMKDGQNKMNEEMLNSIVTQFSSAISGSAGDDMAAFSNSMKQVNEQLSTVISSLHEHQSAMAKNTDTSAKAISDSFTTGAARMHEAMEAHMAQLSGKMDQIVDRLQSSSSHYDSSASMLSKSADEISQVLQSAGDLMQNFKTLSDLSRQNLGDMRTVAERIASTSDAFKEISTQNGEFVGQLRSSLSDMNESHGKLIKMEETLTDAWKEYQDRFITVDKSLEGAFKQIDDGMHRYSNFYTEFLKEMDKQTSSITETLAGAVQELGESIEELGEALKTADR